MPVPVPPTTSRPTHPAWEYHPGSSAALPDHIETRSARLTYDVLGRAGARASVAVRNVVTQVLENDPSAALLGSYVNLHWNAYLGRGPGLHTNSQLSDPAAILFEFRSPAEVTEAAQGGHGFIPFAVTYWNENLDAPSAHAPPCDGLAPDGSLYHQSVYGNAPFARIFIRDDLLAGGAGAQWSGAAFLAETIVHELGHVVTYILSDLYGDDWVRDQACAMFGQPSSAWAAGAWEDRVQEAVAETYKDVLLPRARYRNRTHHMLPHDSFADFLKLFVDYAENPYYEEMDGLFTSWRWFNEGPSIRGKAVTEGPAGGFPQPSYLFTTAERLAELQALGPFKSMVRTDALLAWPYTVGGLQMHWNFNLDPAVSPPNFIGSGWANWDSTTEARVNIGFQFWSTDYAVEGSPGTLLGQVDVEVSPAANAAGYGIVAAPLDSLPFDAPDDGMFVTMAPVKRAAWDNAYLPLDDLVTWDGLTWHFASDRAPGYLYLNPWLEAINLPRLRQPRVLPWPYPIVSATPTVLHLGQIQPARIVLPHRVRGRRLRVV